MSSPPPPPPPPSSTAGDEILHGDEDAGGGSGGLCTPRLDVTGGQDALVSPESPVGTGSPSLGHPSSPWSSGGGLLMGSYSSSSSTTSLPTPSSGAPGASRFTAVVEALRSGDLSRQMEAGLSLSEMLLMVESEDALSGLNRGECISALVDVLRRDDPILSCEAMLWATRCLCHLVDALPDCAGLIISMDAVRVMCEKLMFISYQFFDLTEEFVKLLEKVSWDHHVALLDGGALSTLSVVLGAFDPGAKRLAVRAMANMCQSVSAGTFHRVTDALPTMSALLESTDAKVVESTCLCFSRLVRIFARDEEKLECIASQGLVSHACRLMMGCGPASSSKMRGDVFRMASVMCRGSPTLLALLLHSNIIEATRAALDDCLGRGGARTISSSESRTTIQDVELVSRVLSLAHELLPDLSIGIIPACCRSYRLNSYAISKQQRMGHAISGGRYDRPVDDDPHIGGLYERIMKAVAQDGASVPPPHVMKALASAASGESGIVEIFDRSISSSSSTTTTSSSSSSSSFLSSSKEEGDGMDDKDVDDDGGGDTDDDGHDDGHIGVFERSHDDSTDLDLDVYDDDEEEVDAGTDLDDENDVTDDGKHAASSAPTNHEDHRAILFAGDPEMLQNLVESLLCPIMRVFSSSTSVMVREKALSAITKMIFALDDQGITKLLENVPFSSFLAQCASSTELRSVIPCLVMVENLMEKLPRIFSHYFIKEGMVYELQRWSSKLSPEQLAQRRRSLMEKRASSGTKESVKGKARGDGAKTTQQLGASAARRGKKMLRDGHTSTLGQRDSLTHLRRDLRKLGLSIRKSDMVDEWKAIRSGWRRRIQGALDIEDVAALLVELISYIRPNPKLVISTADGAMKRKPSHREDGDDEGSTLSDWNGLKTLAESSNTPEDLSRAIARCALLYNTGKNKKKSQSKRVGLVGPKVTAHEGESSMMMMEEQEDGVAMNAEPIVDEASPTIQSPSISMDDPIHSRPSIRGGRRGLSSARAGGVTPLGSGGLAPRIALRRSGGRRKTNHASRHQDTNEEMLLWVISKAKELLRSHFDEEDGIGGSNKSVSLLRKHLDSLLSSQTVDTVSLPSSSSSSTKRERVGDEQESIWRDVHLLLRDMSTFEFSSSGCAEAILSYLTCQSTKHVEDGGDDGVYSSILSMRRARWKCFSKVVMEHVPASPSDVDQDDSTVPPRMAVLLNHLHRVVEREECLRVRVWESAGASSSFQCISRPISLILDELPGDGSSLTKESLGKGKEKEEDSYHHSFPDRHRPAGDHTTLIVEPLASVAIMEERIRAIKMESDETKEASDVMGAALFADESEQEEEGDGHDGSPINMEDSSACTPKKGDDTFDDKGDGSEASSLQQLRLFINGRCINGDESSRNKCLLYHLLVSMDGGDRSSPPPNSNEATTRLWKRSHVLHYQWEDSASSMQLDEPSAPRMGESAGLHSKENDVEEDGKCHGGGGGGGVTSPEDYAKDDIDICLQLSADRLVSSSSTSLAELPRSLVLPLEAMRLLHAIMVMETRGSEVLDGCVDAFISDALTSRLKRQMQDTLTICTGHWPAWTMALPRRYAFLFPFDVRREYVCVTSHGLARALECVERTSGSIRVGRIPRDKVAVPREDVLRAAVPLMEQYGPRKAVLEVEYYGESGVGSGPTLEFYAMVSRALHRVGMGMWLGDHPPRLAQRPAASWWDRQGERGGDGGETISVGRGGLFPRPLPPQEREARESTVRRQFKFVGTLVAKAMMDGRLVELPLSRPLLHWMLGQPITTQCLCSGIPLLRSFLPVLIELVKEKKMILEDSRLSESEQEDRLGKLCFRGAPLAELELDFSLPGCPEYPLVPNGHELTVTHENVERYIERIVSVYTREGVQVQLAALKEGFDAVFPMSSLAPLSAVELDQLICGQADDPSQWTPRVLRQAFACDHGYARDSAPVRRLVEAMASFSPKQRRLFVEFLTGSPRLPIGGWASLSPPLTVVKKEVEHPDCYLPSVMTCANYLKLPPYTSTSVTKEKVLAAISEGGGEFHLS